MFLVEKYHIQRLGCKRLKDARRLDNVQESWQEA